MKLFGRVIDFIYPPLCRHCQITVKERSHLLCRACAEYLVLVDVFGRCPHCFIPVEGQIVCASCASKAAPYKKCAATCEHRGPALTLLRQFQQGSHQLKNAIGSLMAMQVLQLDWTLPDVIVPIPTPRMQILRCGFDHNVSLAEQIGSILERPVRTNKALQRAKWCEKRILLVVDQLNQEQARKVASVLLDSFPLEINLISFL